MQRPRIPLDEALAVACMALLVAITLLNVVTRYLSDASYAWTEELSVFLLVVMTLAGAAAAAGRDRHIRIELVYDGGSAARRRVLALFSGVASGLLFSLLAVLFARVVADEMRYAETSMGLGVPRWWYTAFSPLLCALLAWRSFAAARAAWTRPARR